MHTIEAFEKDILFEVTFLKKFTEQKTLSDTKQRQTLFCGSGDSLAAALLAEAFSNFKVKAIDPLDLLKNPSLAKNNAIYFVSISGNTITNIKAAKITKKSIAITTNTKSKLATVCKSTLPLHFPNSGVFTSGSIGFLASAMTCISLVRKLHFNGISNLFKKAVLISKRIIPNGKVFILGNLHTFPIAMYMSAKFYEILGIDAHYERIEQFLHMGLFSAKAGDTVIVLEEKNPHNFKLIKNLKKVGLRIIHPLPGTKNKVKQIIFFTFVAQLVPLFCAKKNHQQDCYFVTAKNIRNVSSNMIY